MFGAEESAKVPNGRRFQRVFRTTSCPDSVSVLGSGRVEHLGPTLAQFLLLAETRCKVDCHERSKRVRRLKEELRLILEWERAWGGPSPDQLSQVGKVARAMRREEIVGELILIIEEFAGEAVPDWDRDKTKIPIIESAWLCPIS